MYAWELDETTSRLRSLQREEWADAALAAVTLALALGATQLMPTLAFPLMIGALAVAYLALRAFWRHWELVDRLLLERDAYEIRDVRLRAERSATMENRHTLANSIRWLLDQPGSPSADRVRAAAELEALMQELDDAELSFDPACAVACERLLTEGGASPLLNPALRADDAGARVRQIRAGFQPRPAASRFASSSIRASRV